MNSRLPDVIEQLNRSARHAARARVAWDDLLEELPGLGVARDKRGISVAAPILHGYRSALRHAVLAAAGRQIGVVLGDRRLTAVDRLLSGRAGAGAVVLAAGVRAELAFGRLTLYRDREPGGEEVALAPDSDVRLGGASFRVTRMRAGAATRSGWSAGLVPATFRARRWRTGDRIRPLGGTGSRAVSVLLREARVPPARRREWPVVVTGDDATIVWVPGICRSDVAVPAEGTEAWCVECAFT